MAENTSNDSIEEKKVPLSIAIMFRFLKKGEFLLYENDGDHLSEEDEQEELSFSDILDPNNIYIRESLYSKFLITALRLEEEEIVKDLLNNNSYNLNQVDKYGKALLHYVVSCGTFEILKLLVDRGVLLDIGDKWENTPLHYAVQNSSRESVRHLLDSGASVNFKSYQSHTPLHYAAATKDLEIIDMLVSNGADVNAVSKNGSPLCIACGFFDSSPDNSELMKFLKREDKYSYVCDTRVIDYLLDHGAKMNLRTEKKETPLHLACRNGNFEVVEHLLEHGANIKAEGAKMRSTLHYAVMGDNPDIIKLFLDKGFDPNIRDIYNDTPITLAPKYVNRHFEQVLDLLIDYGADIEAQNVAGRTLLDFAVDQIESSLKYVMKLKPNINHLDKEQMTPFQYCVEIFEDMGINDDYEPLEIMTAYIARMIIRNQHVCKENLELLKSKSVERIYKECELQIDRMRTRICSSYNTSFYDILKEDPHRVAAFTRNNELMGVLESSEYEKQFPKFGFFLQDTINEAKRRLALMNAGADFLKKHLKLNLPWTIIDEIFINLDEKDLKIFVQAFGKTS